MLVGNITGKARHTEYIVKDSRAGKKQNKQRKKSTGTNTNTHYYLLTCYLISVFQKGLSALVWLSKGQAEIQGSATVPRQTCKQNRVSQEEMTSYQDSDMEKANFLERNWAKIQFVCALASWEKEISPLRQTKVSGFGRSDHFGSGRHMKNQQCLRDASFFPHLINNPVYYSV